MANENSSRHRIDTRRPSTPPAASSFRRCFTSYRTLKPVTSIRLDNYKPPENGIPYSSLRDMYEESQRSLRQTREELWRVREENRMLQRKQDTQTVKEFLEERVKKSNKMATMFQKETKKFRDEVYLCENYLEQLFDDGVEDLWSEDGAEEDLVYGQADDDEEDELLEQPEDEDAANGPNESEI